MNYYQENENRVLETLQSGREREAAPRQRSGLSVTGPTSCRRRQRIPCSCGFEADERPHDHDFDCGGRCSRALRRFIRGRALPTSSSSWPWSSSTRPLACIRRGAPKRPLRSCSRWRPHSEIAVLRDGNVVVVRSEELVPGRRRAARGGRRRAGPMHA